MIVDRDCGLITAIQASARADAGNWAATTLWADVMIVPTSIGILPAFVGMLLIFPMLGYATWHSYKSLVR